MNVPAHDGLAILLLCHSECAVRVVVRAREWEARQLGSERCVRVGVDCAWVLNIVGVSGTSFEAIVCLNRRNRSLGYATGGSKWLAGYRRQQTRVPQQDSVAQSRVPQCGSEVGRRRAV